MEGHDPLTCELCHGEGVSAELVSLRAENDRLRKALGWIYSYAGGYSGVTGDDAGHLTAVGMHAKEALESPRPSDETGATGV